MKQFEAALRKRRNGIAKIVFGITAFTFVLFSAYRFLFFVQENVVDRPAASATTGKGTADLVRVREIARICGPLCDPDAGLYKNAPNSKRTYRRLPLTDARCRALYGSPLMFAPLHGKVPTRTVPPELVNDFTMNDRIPIKLDYKNNVYLGNEAIHRVWTRKEIGNYVNLIREGALYGTYGPRTTSELYRLLRHIDVVGLRALVVGSEKPWVEAALLAAGARETVTLEFAHVKCDDPRMKAHTPANFSALVLANKMEPFDIIVSHSSLEHSGLGRYGDALNPWGDVVSVAMMWCVAAKNARLVLEVPTAEWDVLSFNVHRQYGPIRLPFLTTNWAFTDIVDSKVWSWRFSKYGRHPRPMVFQRMQ